MEDPLNTLEALIGRRIHSVTQHATDAVNKEIEEIIDKTILSPEIEAIIIQTVEQALLSLGKRYWKRLVVAIIGLLVIQAIILSFILKGLLIVMK